MGKPLEDLLDQLCSGDVAAAERVFVTYEPYLRLVVRRSLPVALRARFDSADIVQSVWADALTGFREAGWRFPNVNALRAFLIKLTRNRFLNRVRQHTTSREKELAFAQGASPYSHEPAPDETARANELWERMVALCPPAHREWLSLRRQGLSPAEIAQRTGLHPSSIRRILSTLFRRLAAG